MEKPPTFRGTCAQLGITDDVFNDSDENEEELNKNKDILMEPLVDEGEDTAADEDESLQLIKNEDTLSEPRVNEKKMLVLMMKVMLKCL